MDKSPHELLDDITHMVEALRLEMTHLVDICRTPPARPQRGEWRGNVTLLRRGCLKRMKRLDAKVWDLDTALNQPDINYQTLKQIKKLIRQAERDRR